MFAPLPIAFPKLELALQGLAHIPSAPLSHDMRSLAARLREAYSAARSDGYQKLRVRDWRQLPYAYWKAGSDSLPQLEPQLVQRYWDEVLPIQLSGSALSASRWLAPLWHTYVFSFDPENPDFELFARQVAERIAPATGAFAEMLRVMHERMAVFEPRGLAQRLAVDVLTAPYGIDGWLQRFKGGTDLPQSKLGDKVFTSMLGAGQGALRSEVVVDKIFGLVRSGRTAAHTSPHRIAFANALLLPWEDHHRPIARGLQNKLLRKFTQSENYGDPRWPGRAGYQWHGVSHEAVSVVKRWLAGRSLQIFVDALKLTADSTWAYREKFWMAYHRQGYIDEAWLVLGSLAQNKLGMLRLSDGFKHAQLQGDSQGSRSVLLLQIGDLTFVEWSHEGALRAYISHSDRSPELYQQSYERADLTNDGSLWMHEQGSENVHPHLYHHHSPLGTWQRKARDFIRRRTGIHLHDAEII